MRTKDQRKELFFLLLTVGGLYFILLFLTGCTEPTVSSKTTNHTIPEKGNIASKPLQVCVIEGVNTLFVKITRVAFFATKETAKILYIKKIPNEN
jgi:hypothetical protein